MKNNEKLTQLLTKEDLIGTIPYLKTLDKKEKKQLTPFLKEQFKYYRKSVQISKNRWSRRATERQNRILVRIAMTCFDLRTFRAHVWNFDKKLMDEILTFYEPSWLNEYINSFGNNDWMPNDLSYNWVMEQTEKGRIIPSRMLITRTLCNAIVSYSRQWGRKCNFTPEILEKYDITLKEHFWNFFHFENTVYSVTRWTNFTDKTVKEDATWINVITDLSKKGKLPRLRLLKECLAAVNRDFNRNLINWYIDLFLALAPTTAELLDLQAELFQVSLSPQSKPVNTMLKLSKQLVKASTFNGTLFIENALILLASETKSVVNSTLMILDKLAKKAPQQRLTICTTVCDVFLHRTANLQTRAAKIISKYGDAENESLLDALLPFQANIMSEAKALLANFLPEEEVVGDIELLPLGPVLVPKLSLEKAIDLPKKFDDLAFLANQALVGNESWQVELLPAAILKFQHEMTEANITKLKPAFQRAYNYIFGHRGSARIGDSERLLAHFLGEYIQVIEEQPSKIEVLKKMLKSFLKKEAAIKADWSQYQQRKVSLVDWSSWSNTIIYEPLEEILLYTLGLLKKGSNLPLLSTPTHAPYWIDPKVFVEKLSVYQQAEALPNQADWQLAISRIAFENLETAIQSAKELLSGEILELTLFLLENKVPKQTDFQYIQEWKVAALTKGKLDEYGLSLFYPKEISNDLLGHFSYAFKITPRKHRTYNYGLQKYEEVWLQEREMVIGEPTKSRLPSWLGSLINKVRPKSSVVTFFLFDYLKIENLWGLGNHEITRFTSLTPNNPTVLISQITKKFLNRPQYSGASDTKAVRLIAQNLLDNWQGGDDITHVFLCNALTCLNKTNRTLAAEIWLKGVRQKTIDSSLLGQIIGQMLQIDFFPLKRLLDVLEDVMFNASAQHNRALLQLLQEIILQLPAKPVRGTKGLLEIYKELLANVTKETPRIDLSEKFEEWKTVSSLKKVVRQLVAA